MSLINPLKLHLRQVYSVFVFLSKTCPVLIIVPRMPIILLIFLELKDKFLKRI